MIKIKKKYTLIPIITALLSIILIVASNFIYKPDSKLYIDFLNDVKNKKVAKVFITNSPNLTVKLSNGQMYQTDNPRTNNFKEVMLKDGVKVSETSFSSLKEAFPFVLLGGSILSLIIMFLLSSNLKAKRFMSVDSLDLSSSNNNDFNFSTIAGNEEAKESVKDIIEFLKNPEKFSTYGARMPKGIILHGEPGTGKTLLAKAIAGEAGVPFYAMSGSDFVQIYVGVGASRIRNLFKKAKSHKRAVIFIDEIDAIGKKRSNSNNGGSEERDQTLNALLTEMSGFNENEGIIVIAATNRLDILDTALLRPGRFDRHIEVTLPDLNAREKILNLHLKNKPTKDIDTLSWAKKTAYFSGAKLESLVNEAAIIACKANSTYIDNSHLDKAFSIVLAGYEKINRDYIKPTDKKITAYHEAGHALISSLVLPDEVVSKVTIIPSTKGAGGYTLSIPEDKMYQNKDYLRKRIMVLLAGRAAEDITFGENHITTGAYNDLKSSTNIALNMVTKFGMGKTLGLLNLEEVSSLMSGSSASILEECKSMIEELYLKTKNILLERQNQLEEISALLIEKETIFTQDINKILSNNDVA